jgi:hypothetical protein
LLRKLLIFKSNNITTNKNKTAIAPTYTTIKIRAKNSHPNINNKLDENKKLTTNHNREYIGLLEKTTKLELIIIPKLKIK